MGERKVLNKYYPRDFDPAKISRAKRPANQQMKVRVMLPASIRCNTCGNYIYKGSKFNSRKEDVIGETYLGIQIFRFYFKCTMCSAEITIKTDPRNSDYVVESGAARNFEPWRAKYDVRDEEQQRRKAEEMRDAMKSLENRTLDSKREMDRLAALDEIKSMKSRHASVTVDGVLETLQLPASVEEDKFDEGDEALIRTYFRGSREIVRRINDDDLDDDELTLSTSHDARTLGSSLKRRKVKQKASDSPTDCLTTASAINRFNNKEDPRDGGPSRGKFLFKSSTVNVSVMKKLPL